MQSLDLTANWPVDNVSAAVIDFGGALAPIVSAVGDVDRVYRLASLTKPITAWGVLVAVEEGVIGLDTPVGQPDCTLRHLLSHAGGYAFNGPTPLVAPGRRRIYSNTGIEMAADAVADAAAMPFSQYLAESVFEPLAMKSSALHGSAAYAAYSSVADLCAFAAEVVTPKLISADMAATATSSVFTGLSGLVPGVGRYRECSWGLGFEIKGDKAPHWMGTTNSPRACGHFGAAGTFMWVDMGEMHDTAMACIALTDRRFDEWAAEALTLWPTLSDAVLAESKARRASP